MPDGIGLDYSLHECGTIQSDSIALERILLNLIQNAVHAMNEKGRLEIRLRPAGQHDPLPKYNPPGKGKRWIELIVADNGKGMDKQTKERIFDPFFTTKKVGTGSGLGLTIVHSLVEQANGIIRVASAPQKGTSFHIYFPSRIK